MIFISAQDLSIQYLWQVYISVCNLSALGISKENIHILFAIHTNQRNTYEENRFLNDIQNIASVFLYNDQRENSNYPSSIRPHIFAQHLLKFPFLEQVQMFYHDCDIYFREFPPLLKDSEVNCWYASDTANYLNSQYIISQIGEDNFTTMCNLVDISSQQVVSQDKNCGGAQYLLQRVSACFLQKVEKDAERIFDFLSQIVKEQRIQGEADVGSPLETNLIQPWCADMWAFLWNAIYFDYSIKVHSDLNFCWPKQPIDAWNKNYLFHNAGITFAESDQYFFKGGYIFHTPFSGTPGMTDKRYCSFNYLTAINKLSLSIQAYELLDFTFLFSIATHSPAQSELLLTSVNYLQKHFDTQVVILEVGPQKLLNPEMFRKPTKLLHASVLNQPPGKKQLFDKLHKETNTPYFCICDPEIIIPISQLIESTKKLRSDCGKRIVPFDNDLIKVDKLASIVFSKILNDEFLDDNADKFLSSFDPNYEGYVFLNKDAYRDARGNSSVLENETIRVAGKMYQLTC